MTTPASPETRPPAPPAAGRLIAGAAVFSMLVNLLMLTGPLFMLQLYDRVLSSRSGATLSVLFLLVVFLHGVMAVLDHARGRIMARVGAMVQTRFEGPLLDAMLDRPATERPDAPPRPTPRDLDAVRRFLAGPGVLALADLPWVPVFLILIFLLHVELGLLALGVAAALALVALAGQYAARPAAEASQSAAQRADTCLSRLHEGAENVAAGGGRGAAVREWLQARASALADELRAGDRMGLAASLGRSLRLLAQSAMLALGGWLVLRDEITAGVMIAASIVLGRALAPVEQMIAQWEGLRAARTGWYRLQGLRFPPAVVEPATPLPGAGLSLPPVPVLPPPGERIALRLPARIDLAPGRALGVIGPAGSGKSALMRLAAGVWPGMGGAVRLGGVPLHRLPRDRAGAMIGYLPQRLHFVPGTLAMAVARGEGPVDPEALQAAIDAAGIGGMIAALPDGAETRIDANGAPLSGGQARRLGLARALYGAPRLLVLDAPDEGLDAQGEAALNRAIRLAKARGAVVVLSAHRPAAVAECDDLIVLDRGMQLAFGPREQVLREQLRNHAELMRAGRFPVAVSTGPGTGQADGA